MIYINTLFSNYLPLSIVNSSFTQFRVGTTTPTAITVDWGDGEITSYSGDLVTISHTYLSPFTGNIKIKCTDGNSLINRMDLFSLLNTNNSIAFTTSQIGAFKGLTIFSYLVGGSNIISGNINLLPSSLTQLVIYGSNTVSGDINDFPTSITSLELGGLNTISGNISDIPSSLMNFNLAGFNTTTGDIGNLPISLTAYTNSGNNTTFGDIGTLKSSLLTYRNTGFNTTSGDIGALPVGLTAYTNSGNNTTFGDIGTLPNTLLTYRNQGANTTTGDIGNLPSLMTSFISDGTNTTFGDIGTLPINLNTYINSGNNIVNQYTGGRTWNSSMNQITNLPTSSSGGLSSIEVDNLLIDLANVTTWIIDKSINLSGNNQPRTSSSDTAVTTLSGLGVSVGTN